MLWLFFEAMILFVRCTHIPYTILLGEQCGI